MNNYLRFRWPLVMIVILAITVAALFSACGSEPEPNAPITYEIISTDETVQIVLCNNAGVDGSQYAWYVLNETNEPLEKTGYSEQNDFSYTLHWDDAIIFKGFVRTSAGEEEEKTSYTVESTTILDEAARNYIASSKASTLGEEPIGWVNIVGDTYIFCNNAGESGSRYSWELLDKDKTALVKYHTYSASNRLICSFLDSNIAYVKGYVRTGTEENFTQASYRLDVEQIANSCTPTVYQVDESFINISAAIELFRSYLSGLEGGTISFEKVLAGDGSDWELALTLPVKWECADVSNRSYGFRTNGLLFLDGLYREYLKTKNETYAKVILSYVLDWVRQNQTYDAAQQWIWHDDATAMRVFRMSLYFVEFQEFLTKEEATLLRNSLDYQAELLSSDEFYTERHNHGMHQDMALLAYSILLADGEKRTSYMETALSRTADYLDYVYTTDGVHKEHSPFYAQDALKAAKLFLKLADKMSPDFADHIAPYVSGGQEFLIQLIKPDKTQPSFGDSSKGKIEDVGVVCSENSGYQYVYSDGRVGTSPAADVVFPEGGYAVFRSSWDDSAVDATWMCFNAATFSSTHKHGDDLEVLLYHKGDLFVEAGKRNYNYADKETAYAYSGYGHNVLLVDGEAYPVKIGSNGFQSIYPDALKTGITDFALGEDIVSVTGAQYRFEGIEQLRTLAYDKQKSVVEIRDVLTANRTFDGTLLYHIAQGIEVQCVPNGWLLLRDDVPVARISVTSSLSELELSEFTGGSEGSAPYYTWIFEGEEEPQIGSLLKIDGICPVGETEIITTIELL